MAADPTTQWNVVRSVIQGIGDISVRDLAFVRVKRSDGAITYPSCEEGAVLREQRSWTRCQVALIGNFNRSGRELSCLGRAGLAEYRPSEGCPTSTVHGAVLYLARQGSNTTDHMNDHNFPGLRSGDVFPAVGVLQRLLVRAGHDIPIDGEFGSGTVRALKAFQEEHGLPDSGRVDLWTWQRLCAGEHLPILDVVDVCDPSLYNLEVKDLRWSGADPIQLGGMSNGVEQAIDLIRSRAPAGLFLLRFHGHGAPGGAAISAGDWSISGGYELDVINTWALEYMAVLLQRLRGLFGPYGCIQFMHCRTGRGTKGAQLMRMVAQATGVPATAAIDTQYGGGNSTWFYEGPTRTRLPGAASIGSWSRTRPPFSAPLVCEAW